MQALMRAIRFLSYLYFSVNSAVPVPSTRCYRPLLRISPSIGCKLHTNEMVHELRICTFMFDSAKIDGLRQCPRIVLQTYVSLVKTLGPRVCYIR